MTNGLPQSKYPIGAAVTTLQVVEALKELDGAGVSELADHLDMSTSNVHNYLNTLRQEGYVYKNKSVYYVGLQFLELGAYSRKQRPIYKVAQPELRELAEKTGERANLMVEENGKGFYLSHEAGSRAVSVDTYVGSQVHLHNTAFGKAILANYREERVDEIIDWWGLPQTTENTITDRAELKKELSTIENNGVAFDREERLKSLRCVAVPVVDSAGTVYGAISVSGPKTRFQGDRFTEEIPNQLQQVANIIELNLTHG